MSVLFFIQCVSCCSHTVTVLTLSVEKFCCHNGRLPVDLQKYEISSVEKYTSAYPLEFPIFTIYMYLFITTVMATELPFIQR